MTDISIQWLQAPSLPTGIEEAFFNIINNKLIFCCGFNGGHRFSFTGKKNDLKKNKYVRGLKVDSHSFDLAIYNHTKLSVPANDSFWSHIPDFLGSPRQAGRSVCIDNIMYCYGGQSFNPIINHKSNSHRNPKKALRTLNDGYSLRLLNNNWIWNKLPNLPINISGFGMTTIGKYIYICCGVHKNVNSRQWHLSVKYNDNNILYRLDTTKLNHNNNQWEVYDTLPTSFSSRYNAAVTHIDHTIYIIGGIASNDKWVFYKHAAQKTRYLNVSDNWKYNIVTKKWSQLSDVLNDFSNWGCVNDKIVYHNRYIILLGGFAYSNSVTNNVTSKNKSHSLAFSNKIIVYDTVCDNYNILNTHLFCKVNVPNYLIDGDYIYIIGGEIKRFKYHNEYYGTHSDMFFIGNINAKLI